MRKQRSLDALVAGICLALILTSCQSQETTSGGESTGSVLTGQSMEVGGMKISSPAFAHGQPIPAKFTGDGEDVSPALEWSGVPVEAKSLALVCDDPDAPMGTWIHWIVVNIPADVSGIPENGPLPPDAVEIRNSFGKTAYGGPCPPAGTHRYFFRLYALDVPKLKDVNPQNYKALISQHTIAQAELMGTYQRR